MTVKEVLSQLQQRFEIHIKDEQLTHQEQNQRITEMEEYQKTIRGWIEWGLKIILASILVGLLALLGFKQ